MMVTLSVPNGASDCAAGTTLNVTVSSPAMIDRNAALVIPAS
jgi:hypothetical protein